MKTEEINIELNEYDLKIYPRKIWVIFNLKTPEVLVDIFPSLKGAEESLKRIADKSNLASTWRVEDAEGFCGVLIVTCHKTLEVESMTHEAVHAADAIAEDIGLIGQNFCDGNEHMAYLTGHIAGCIDEAMKHSKKKK